MPLFVPSLNPLFEGDCCIGLIIIVDLVLLVSLSLLMREIQIFSIFSDVWHLIRFSTSSLKVNDLN